MVDCVQVYYTYINNCKYMVMWLLTIRISVDSLIDVGSIFEDLTCGIPKGVCIMYHAYNAIRICL